MCATGGCGGGVVSLKNYFRLSWIIVINVSIQLITQKIDSSQPMFYVIMSSSPTNIEACNYARLISPPVLFIVVTVI